MNSSQSNKVLLSEVKKTLDEQEQSIGFPIQSRLTQARFHAIDRGILHNSFHTYNPLGRSFNHSFQIKKVAVASAFLVAIVALFSTAGTLQQDVTVPVVSPVSNNNSIRTVESSEEDNEDTKEEVDVYHWLYEHYG